MIPAVSIVLPFRDAADTIAEALESLRTQTCTSFEALLVDHQSRDASVDIARSLCRRDARFRLLTAAGSFVDALNTGLAAARGAWLARMDADDRCHPQRLERQLALLATDPTLSIAGCHVACTAAGRLRQGMRRYEAWLNSIATPEEIRNALFVESPLAHPSVVVSRDAIRAVGGYQETNGPEDYDLWMRLLLAGHRAAKVPAVLLEWRDTPSRLTRTDPRYRRERFFATKLRYIERVIPSATPLQIWGAGPIGRRWGRALRQRGFAVRRFIDVDPRKLRRSIAGAPVEPPATVSQRDGFVLAAVGSPGARERIDAFLRDAGCRPWIDYLAVA